MEALTHSLPERLPGEPLLSGQTLTFGELHVGDVELAGTGVTIRVLLDAGAEEVGEWIGFVLILVRGGANGARVAEALLLPVEALFNGPA